MKRTERSEERFWRWRSILTPIACLALLIPALSAVPGVRAAVAEPSWSAPVNVDGTDELDAVSCVSVSFCEAVDTSGNAVTWNGVQWTAGGIASGTFTVSCTSASFCQAGTGDVDGVSCTSPTFCMEVDNRGNAYSWNGSSWSSAVNIDGANPLNGVFCSSANFCAAVGQRSDAAVWNGANWSKPVSTEQTGFLISVACASSDFCIAVGSLGNAVMWNGSSWSAPANIDASDILDSVSCTSTSFCVAVDVGGNALVWNGSTWSTPQSIDAGGFPFGPLYGVSCVSPTFCVAVDGGGNALVYASLTVTSSALPGATVGRKYSANLGAVGGSPPYKWALSSGALPSGLKLNATTGAIEGTPTSATNASFIVSLSDSSIPSQMATADLTIAVTKAAPKLSLLAVKVGKGGVSPEKLYRGPSISKFKIGQKVRLAVYGAVSGLADGSVTLSIGFQVTRAGKTALSQTTAAFFSRLSSGKRLSWSAFFTPHQPGQYVFTGTLSLGKKHHHQVTRFKVTSK